MPDGTNLATYYVQIVPTTKDIGSQLQGAIGGEADSAGSSFANKFASAFKKVVVGLGLSRVVSEALNFGGALQQSIGGIGTLFGTVMVNGEEVMSDAAQKMVDYANQAYSTIGISANDYMENVIGFSASLKQALGGDMDAVAEIANMAMQDMGDNAAKMGTDMASIQAAYQGFAKQNYTLLDNLKLGYGGTKSEMERLLKDAQAITGIKYDIDNLDDVYKAIHVIQGELGLTESAAEEASQTYTGSMAAMKAAGENLLANLSLGKDISGPLRALCETTQNFLLKNLIPMVVNIIKGIPSTIKTLGLGFIEAGIGLITDFGSSIREGLGEYISLGIDMITSLVEGIVASLPTITAAAFQLLGELVGSIAENLPMIVDAAQHIIYTLVQGFIDNLPNIVASAATIVSSIWDTIKNVDWLGLGMKVIEFIAEGIPTMAINLITAVVKLAKDAWEAFKNYDWSELGTNLIEGIKTGVTAAATKLKDSVVNAAKNALNAVKGFLGIHSPSTVFRDMIGKNMAMGIGVGFEDYMPVDEMIKEVEGITKATVGALDNGYISTPYNANRKGLFGRTDETITNNSSTVGVSGGVTVNVYGADKNIGEIVDEVIDAIESNIMMTRRVFQ